MHQSHSKWPVLLLNRGRLVWPSNWKPIEFAFKTESNAGLHFKGTPFKGSVQSVPYFILPIIEHPPQLRLLCSEVDTKAKLYLYDTTVTKVWIVSWRRMTRNGFSYQGLHFFEVKISLSKVRNFNENISKCDPLTSSDLSDHEKCRTDFFSKIAFKLKPFSWQF